MILYTRLDIILGKYIKISRNVTWTREIVMRSTSSSYIGGIGDKGRRYMGGAKGGVKTYEQSLYLENALFRY